MPVNRRNPKMPRKRTKRHARVTRRGPRCDVCGFTPACVRLGNTYYCIVCIVAELKRRQAARQCGAGVATSSSS